MNNQQHTIIKICCIVWLLCLFNLPVFAQLEKSVNQPIGPGGTPLANDSLGAKTNTSEWDSEHINVFWNKAFSEKKELPDSSIAHFHRRKILPFGLVNLGNSGSPALPIVYQPYNNNGPTLGYHAWDNYRYELDSLQYYNTTRPYSLFQYQLGSKQEQLAEITHSQNITPQWNFVARYRKITSPGFYKIQRNNLDNGSFATQYKSKLQHYQLYAGVVYNKQQHDANGGIVSDSFLHKDQYNERSLIPVRYQNDQYSNQRSSVTNVMRDVQVQLKHAYTIGKRDTTYNSDSTQLFYQLIPRFRIMHNALFVSEKFSFEDKAPDSIRYQQWMNYSFLNKDSVMMIQRHIAVDNNFSLGGYFGKAGKQVEFAAGLGIRFDKFTTSDTVRLHQLDGLSNYLFGTINKEALGKYDWQYKVAAKFFFTGYVAGDLNVEAQISKALKNDWLSVHLSMQQMVNNAPYNYRYVQYKTYTDGLTDPNKESVTVISGELAAEKLRMSVGLKSYAIGNTFFVNDQWKVQQDNAVFNLTQLLVNWHLKLGLFHLYNEAVLQKVTDNAPVNVPLLFSRHQLSVETSIFQKALGIAVGVEATMHTAFESAGYAPLLARYTYQNTYRAQNTPVLSAFFNFRVKKRFRCYVMGEQISQLFSQNQIITEGYPNQNTMLRFGFAWMLVN